MSNRTETINKIIDERDLRWQEVGKVFERRKVLKTFASADKSKKEISLSRNIPRMECYHTEKPKNVIYRSRQILKCNIPEQAYLRM